MPGEGGHCRTRPSSLSPLTIYAAVMSCKSNTSRSRGGADRAGTGRRGRRAAAESARSPLRSRR